jgi:hypothetical protein
MAPRPHPDIIPTHVPLEKHFTAVLGLEIARLEGKFECLDEKQERIARQREEDRQDMDRRLAGMNEIRDQLNRQAATFLTITTYSDSHESLRQRIDRLEQNQAKAAGKASQTSVLVLGAVAVISAIVAVYAAFKP